MLSQNCHDEPLLQIAKTKLGELTFVHIIHSNDLKAADDTPGNESDGQILDHCGVSSSDEEAEFEFE